MKKHIDRLNDTRLVERHIEKGMLSEEEHAAFVKALPDAADKATALGIKPQVEAEETEEAAPAEA